MIFAEIQYERHYSDVHYELVNLMESRFSKVESGLQGDSWIWVFEDDVKVEIDTFSSMKHQVKSNYRESRLITEIIEFLKLEYYVRVYNSPEPDAHE